MKELPKLLPVPILVTSYNRIGFLKKTIDNINSNTLYPFYLLIVDSNSTDGSVDYLKSAKVRGKIFDHLFLSENRGQSVALNELIKLVDYWQKRRRPMADWVVFSNEDIITPKLRPKCWLEQMIDIFERHEEEDNLGALSLRIERLARAEIDSQSEIIFWLKGIPSVYRLMRWTDIVKLGDKPMGELRKWNSNTVADKLKFQLKKRYGFTTNLYGSHLGWCEGKGFKKGVDTLTVAENKINEHKDKPYCDIDPETNVPIKVNHPCDIPEMKLRDEAKEKIASIEIKYENPEYSKIIKNGEFGSDEYCMIKEIRAILSWWNSKK